MADVEMSSAPKPRSSKSTSLLRWIRSFGVDGRITLLCWLSVVLEVFMDSVGNGGTDGRILLMSYRPSIREQPRPPYYGHSENRQTVAQERREDVSLGVVYHVYRLELTWSISLSVTREKKTFVKSIIREVAGFSPYERRLMELLRNSKDKKAKKLAKKRVSRLTAAACSATSVTRRRLDGHYRSQQLGTADSFPQLGTLLRSKRKIEELSNVIQEQRRQTGH